MEELTPGTPVTTTTDRAGVILDPPWLMPVHCLVQFDTGETWWILRSALRVRVVEVKVKRGRKALCK